MATKASWDYAQHAQLAHALVISDSEGEVSLTESDHIFDECARQAALLAIRRAPYLVGGDAGMEATTLIEQGSGVGKMLKQEVTDALRRADDMVRRHFSSGEKRPEDDELIEEVLAMHRTQEIAKTRRQSRRQ